MQVEKLFNMMIRRADSSRSFLFILILSFFTQRSYGQQPVTFTQNMDNLAPINASFSLFTDEAGSLYSSARRQWLGINGAPATFLLNANLAIPKISGEAGFILTSDQLAVERTLDLNLFLAKSILLNESQHLAVSLNFGIRHYTTAYSSLDTNDPVTRSDINEYLPNVGFGVLWYNDDNYIGFSVPQLNVRALGMASQQPPSDFRSTFYAMAGVGTKLNADFKVKPSVLFAYAKGLPVTAYISGMIYAKDILGFGVSYHSNSEVAGIMSLDIQNVHFGYSYQFGITGKTISGFGNSTHEVLLAYHFGRDDKKPHLF